MIQQSYGGGEVERRVVYDLRKMKEEVCVCVPLCDADGGQVLRL